MENQCCERIPIFIENKLHFVDQVTRKTSPWFIRAPCKSDNFESYRLTPYPIKAGNPVRTFTPDEVENHSTHAIFKQFGIYSQHDWTKSIDKMKFNHLVDDSAEKFEVAQAVNFADLA